MARVERRYTIQTCDSFVRRTALRWGTRVSSSAPPLRLNFSLGPAGRCAFPTRRSSDLCEGGAGNGSGRASVHDTNLRSVGEQKRCQVEPTILFECPAPAAEFFPVASRQMRG